MSGIDAVLRNHEQRWWRPMSSPVMISMVLQVLLGDLCFKIASELVWCRCNVDGDELWRWIVVRTRMVICRSDDDDCNSFANDHPLMVVMMMGEGGKQVLYSLKWRRFDAKNIKTTSVWCQKHGVILMLGKKK